jgi:hypothetical protein
MTKLRIGIGILVGFSAVVSGLTHNDIRAASLEPQPRRPMRITVSFGGLMVFQREDMGYKIGVAVSAEHTLKALVDDQRRAIPTIFPNANWYLEVTNSSPTGVKPVEEGHDETRQG